MYLDLVTGPAGAPLALRSLVAALKRAVSAVAHLGVGIAALDDEAGDDPVERLPIEVALLRQLAEAVNVCGRHVVPQLKLHGARRRLDCERRVGGEGRHGARRGQCGGRRRRTEPHCRRTVDMVSRTGRRMAVVRQERRPQHGTHGQGGASGGQARERG